MSDAALEIRGLEKSFRSFTLGPFDMTVPRGAVYALIGPNGAGKTTTFDLIFGMGAKKAGSISVLGLDHLRDEVAMKERVAYVGPDLSFKSWFRIRSLLRFVRGFHSTWDDEYCARLLDTFELSLKQSPATLSFGGRTKLSLVIAMAWRPQMLILDEPTVGLDPIAKQFVFSELLSAVADGTRTVVISSHNLTDMERFADQVGLIRNGRMLFEGEMTTLVDRFRMVDFTAASARSIEGRAGIFVQRRDADRWRVLVDRETAPVEALIARGAQELSDSPVTLEDIFVGLGRG
jgi:ABC-2 type transport system ATP-binding protein